MKFKAAFLSIAFAAISLSFATAKIFELMIWGQSLSIVKIDVLGESPTLSTADSEYTKGIFLDSKAKSELFNQYAEEIREDISEMVDTHKALVEQLIVFNKEIRETTEKYYKTAAKKEKPKVVKPVAVSPKKLQVFPLTQMENSEDKEMVINGAINFKRSGYSITGVKGIKIAQLTQFLKDDYSSVESKTLVATNEKTAEKPKVEAPKVVEKPKESVKPEISEKDRLVYKYSANYKEDAPIEAVVEPVKKPTKVVLSDQISKLEPPKVARKIDNPEKDEKLIMFDYSEDIEPKAKPDRIAEATQKIVEPIVSSVVVNTQPEIKVADYPKSPNPVVNTQKKETNKKEQKHFAANWSAADSSYQALLNRKVKDEVNSWTTIKMSSVDLGNNIQNLNEFEVQFIDSDESLKSNVDGAVFLDENLKETSVRRMRIYSKDHVDMVTDLVMEKAKVEVDVPVFTRTSFYSLMSDEKIDEYTASILVDLDERTKSIEIDDSEAKIMYFDKKFGDTDLEHSDYALILNINPGNRTLTYTTADGYKVSKVIHLTEQTVYFEQNYYDTDDVLNIEIFEKPVLASSPIPYNISTKDIYNEFNKEVPSKLNPNTLKFTQLDRSLGMSRYFTVYKDQREHTVVLRGQKKIVLPTEEMVQNVLDELGEPLSGHRCVLQLNLNKNKIKDLQYNGMTVLNNRGGSLNRSEVMSLDHMTLDDDGSFYDSVSRHTEKIYVLGEGTGVVSFKLEYQDGSVEYQQTLCLHGDYLIQEF
ncbi:MAG: hypothetical protein H6621_06875 [Halobacteriovoraceae bacterium]|nr:hypothetical protein [Halobacteriovoraceae bacterium]